MAKECFCGCGRKVPFGRKRITNMLGKHLTEDEFAQAKQRLLADL